MVFRQHVLSIKTLTIILKLSVLFLLNFNLIPSVKVSTNSDSLPESINDTINMQFAEITRWTPQILIVLD